MDDKQDSELQLRTNQKLRLYFQHPRGYYKAVQVLLIYWEKSDLGGCREEAIQLGELFSKKLNYSVSHFRIPSEDSQLALDAEIGKFVKQAKVLQALSIIHYGGHGDENIESKDGSRGKDDSVWAAMGHGALTDGNSLTWSEIQPKLKLAGHDVLLLLDCCFAGLAARDRNRGIPDNVELLAACSMSSMTPGPGRNRRSFTRALIEVLTSLLDAQPPVTVSALYTALNVKEAGLFQNPFYIPLAGSKYTITLAPLLLNQGAEGATRPRAELRLRLLLNNPVTDTLLDEILNWLQTNCPNQIVGVEVAEICELARSLKSMAMEDTVRGHQLARIETIPQSSQREIQSAWKVFVSRLEGRVRLLATALEIGSGNDSPTELLHQSTRSFLEDFRPYVAAFQSVVERTILELPAFFEEAKITAGVSEPLFQEIKVSESLKVRLQAMSKESTPGTRLDTNGRAFHGFDGLTLGTLNPLRIGELSPHGRVLIEYKYLDERDEGTLRASVQQIRQLTAVLQQAQDPLFRIPFCLGFTEDTNRAHGARYMLLFKAPESRCALINLYSLFEGKSSPRPTLGQRFKLAWAIGKALLKWHRADWLHQGISSHNIVFMKSDDGAVDYTAPFICGFDYSRKLGTTSRYRRSNESELLDIYRHPERQGYPPTFTHTKKHDIYSFGVVLMEIGAWVAMATGLQRQLRTNGASCVRQEIKRKIPLHLPHEMGKAFESAVLTCINGDLGSQLDDSFQSQVMRDFERKVLQRLEIGIKMDG